MFVIKLWLHVCAIIKGILYRLIFRKKLSLGNNITWRRRFNIIIDNNGKVVIGNNCFFNNDCSINCLNSISIGENSIFGENVRIYDHNHKFCDEFTSIKEQGYSIGTVSIGDNCWIGSNVVILKGTEIGNHCVIAAGTVISDKIPSNTIVRDVRKHKFETISVRREDKNE